MQIKEKYGGLRWYDNGFPSKGYDEYSAWLRKYEDLSEITCIVCGKPGEMRYGRWISPYCDEHSMGDPTLAEAEAKRAAAEPKKPYVENDLDS